MELYKLEKTGFYQCFKLGEKISEGDYEYYNYVSIKIDPSGLKHITDILSPADYEQIKTDFELTTESTILSDLSKRIDLSNLDETKVYKSYYYKFHEFYVAKRKSRLETDKIMKEKPNLDFYEVYEDRQQINQVYDYKNVLDDIKLEVQKKGNFIHHLLMDRAFREVIHLYLSNKIKVDQ